VRPAPKLSLSGIDYFQLLIDRLARKKGGRGHDARLLIVLDGIVEKEELSVYFENHSLSQQLFGMRLATNFGVGFPYWTHKPGQAKVCLNYQSHPTNQIPDSAFQTTLDPYTGPPLSIDIHYLKNSQTALLFNVSHILFDFHSLQAYVYSLAGLIGGQGVVFSKRKMPATGKTRLFFKAIGFVFKNGNSRMGVLKKSKMQTDPVKLSYRHIEFSKEESEIINHSVEKQRLSITPSVYFSAYVAKILNDELIKIKNNKSFLWVPIPVNTRLRGIADNSLGNHLTFLFLKLKSSDLLTFQTAIKAIKEQTIYQIKSLLPIAFSVFMDGYRFMPLRFYYAMFSLPSFGKMSSFSFSMLGDTFQGLNDFLGHKVIDIRNYPSNPIRPGVTFLFYRYNGKLNLTTSWLEGHYSDREQQMVVDKIKDALLKD
jgi:hypothetical protein